MKLLVRLRNLLQFQLEQFMLRGVLSRLLVIACAMVLIAVSAGLLVYNVPHIGEAGEEGDPGSAIWWAFLRLTDSGYLGDDEGTLLRTVSTTLTILGVVLFVGALIATMTQWLDDTIETLEAGYTPIAKNNHILILGWSSRTAGMVENLVQSQARVKRFLDRHGGGRLHIVILAERVNTGMAQELKDRLGRRYDARRITLRSGTPLRADHLRRVDFEHAAAVILAGREFDGDGAGDEATIKTLINATGSSEDKLPLVVAEVFDANHLATAARAYAGEAELIGAGRIVARLLAQNTRNRGLSWVYGELLNGKDEQIFVRECPSLVGERLVDVAGCFDKAVLLGAARDGALIPVHREDGERVRDGDRLAFIARAFDDCAPTGAPETVITASPVERRERAARSRGHRRVLVLGWNRKLPSLLAEFEAYRRESVTIDVFSLRPIAERETLLARQGVRFAHASVRQIEGDFTSYHDLGRLSLADYDNIILLASDWLGSAEAADARMVMGYLVLAQQLEKVDQPPFTLVETMSAENAALFDAPHVERLISPAIQSSLLTQVALRRELHWVMEELFGAGGAEVVFRDASRLGLAGGEDSFETLRRARAGEDEILLGVMRGPETAQPRLQLNVRDKHVPLNLKAGDELVVLAVPAAALSTGEVG
ncbi:ion channel DMI1 [Salinisphaera sp. C84B14]|uniref:CASTOR/POLLUX-related putative ion channel n=1 Tax=Salinisphaera sp. C84B14 TaxID=1304155 RepID=UPI003342BF83